MMSSIQHACTPRPEAVNLRKIAGVDSLPLEVKAIAGTPSAKSSICLGCWGSRVPGITGVQGLGLYSRGFRVFRAFRVLGFRV